MDSLIYMFAMKGNNQILCKFIDFQVSVWKEANGIVSLKWPGNSPDLNPIENLWRIVGKELDKDKPKSKNNLTHGILHVWHQKIMLGTLQSLVESMPRRLEAVIKAKSGSTKY